MPRGDSVSQRRGYSARDNAAPLVDRAVPSLSRQADRSNSPSQRYFIDGERG
ncbi:hypothetical protein J6590_051679 [Homalodisca vitripennis]|nr:hypothetical protein J6590_051679 [Homalodisca vitripennis]